MRRTCSIRFQHIKQISLFMTFLAIAWSSAALSAANILTMKAGPLQFSLDDHGLVTSLKDTVKEKEYIVDSEKSFLLSAGTEFNDRVTAPTSAEVVKSNEKIAYVKFKYPFGAEIYVKVVNRGKHISFEIVKVKSPKRIASVRWGEVRVAMHGPIGRWIAMARSDDFAIAFLPLSDNTVGMGNNGYAANYFQKGTMLFLEAYNQETTKSLSTEFKTDYMNVQPLPGKTVKGSKIAIAGCRKGYNNELNLMEAIELAEGLPHPKYKGVWVKRSREVVKPALWIGHNQKNMDSIIEAAKSMNVGNIIQFLGFYKNWGHFDIDPNPYPGGWPALKADADKCKKNDINLGFYSLTYFTKPMSGVEPFIAPVPDKRLANLKIKLHLVAPVSADEKNELRIAYSKELDEVWGKRFRGWYKVLRIDNEMIEAKEFKRDGNAFVFKNLTRGAFKGEAKPHSKNAPVIAMVAGGYHCFFPGTVDMHVQLAKIQVKRILDNDLGLYILDGFGEATGHGAYAKNKFMEVINNAFKNRDLILTTSPSQSIFNWHSISFFSWGEYEMYKGFRGTMIDYRLMRQVQLENNLVPKKLGQYYPNNATAEDIEWLMNLIAGWDSGVDFSMDINTIKRNPDYSKITALIKLWEEARLKNVFNEKQKMLMRQTDTIYSLSKVGNKWNLKFKKFSYDKKMKLLPSSVFNIKPLENGTVSKCSIKWRQTHDPGIHLESAISDDLKMKTASGKSATWEVVYPKPADNRSGTHQKLQFVLRNTGKATIKDLKVKVNDHSLIIPGVLKPGEYIANPHLLHKVFVYDSKTDFVKREVYVPQDNPYWFVPEFDKGKPIKVSVLCDTVKPGASADVSLNLVLRHKLYEGCRKK